MAGSKIHQELMRIEEERGYLDPQVVVEYAQDPDSVLHGAFEWDQDEAARKYRMWQARQLIKSVQVQYKGKPAPAFLNVTVNYEENKSGYMSSSKVLSNRDLAKETMQDALERIEHWRMVYGQLKELSEIVNEDALEEAKKKL